MNFFGRDKWMVEALVIISAQLHSVQRKLDTLLAALPNVSKAQLDELAKKLEGPTESLAEAIEKNKPK